MSELIPVTKENVFINAKVTYKNTIWFVVKVNEKTLYISSKSNFISLWENKTLKINWKKFCENNSCKMVKYDNIFINNDEITKGKNFITSIKKNKKKRMLSDSLEKQVKHFYKNLFLKSKSGWTTPIEGTDGKTIVIIKFNSAGQALIRSDKDYFFYDITSNTYTFWRQLGKKRENKEIPWPEIQNTTEPSKKDTISQEIFAIKG